MTVPRLGLSSWHTIVLGLAVELALENAGLVFVSVFTERRWRERVLVIVPLAAFVWMMGAARGIQLQHTYWSSYFAFLHANYSDYYSLLFAQAQQDYQRVVDDVNSLGWSAVLVTEVMVLFGGMLVFRWGSTAGWWGLGRWDLGRRRVAPICVKPGEDEDDAGELEIFVEPLSRIRHD
jgi:hypothetical protein